MEAREIRYKFFISTLEGFIKNDLQLKTLKWVTDNPALRFELVTNLDDTAALINEHYWELMLKKVKPSILASNEEEDKIGDIYKILSCTEYAIMSVKPFVATLDGKNINYNYSPTNKELLHENILNAIYAFTAAVNILSSWKGKYSKLFSNSKILEIVNYKEEIKERENAMTILDEHLHIMAFGTANATLPIFTNSTWWRLLCLLCETEWPIKKNK